MRITPLEGAKLKLISIILRMFIAELISLCFYIIINVNTLFTRTYYTLSAIILFCNLLENFQRREESISATRQRFSTNLLIRKIFTPVVSKYFQVIIIQQFI